ncbi:hypothetical protein GEV33_014018 [Tenebrio molitor]|uniref:Uncharacterized protein n=1 Tax=Tenebrio molitor TaxID=7067 RepID=A0A8J6H7N8_TENMO|nr:hypothetical protein GEV33_014018 [Tenebrio molitor]
MCRSGAGFTIIPHQRGRVQTRVKRGNNECLKRGDQRGSSGTAGAIMTAVGMGTIGPSTVAAASTFVLLLLAVPHTDALELATKAISVKCKPGANSLRVFNSEADKIAFTQSNGPLSHQVLDDYCFGYTNNDLSLSSASTDPPTQKDKPESKLQVNSLFPVHHTIPSSVVFGSPRDPPVRWSAAPGFPTKDPPFAQ